MSLPEIAFPLFRLRTAVDSLFASRVSDRPAVPSAFHSAAVGLLVALAYYGGSQVGFFLTPDGSPISAFWPPNAILLAALLLTSRRIWWVLILAVLPAHLFIQLGAGVPLLSSLAWFLGNTGEALLGAVCVSAFTKNDSLFGSTRGVIVFLSCGVLLPTLATSFLDAAGVVLTGFGRGYWTLWTTRLTSNVVSDLTIVPIIVVFGAQGLSWFRRKNTSTYYEAAALMVSAVVVGFLAFGQQSSMSSFWPFVYALLPLMFWALLRFGAGGVSASLLVVALISFWHTAHGRGPFGSETREFAILSLHFLLTVLATSFLFSSALIAERRSDEKKRRAKFGDLVRADGLEHYRIARELHDNILQRLTLLSLHVDELRTAPVVVAKPPFNSLYDQISDISSRVRDLSHDVHPFALEYLGLSRALRQLCRKAGVESGIAIDFSQHGTAPLLPLGVSGCLFRVAQEALQDIVRYSRAKTALMELNLVSRAVVLRVCDNGGGGLDALRAERVGMTYSREHVLTLDGTLEIVSVPSRGTMIEVSIPIECIS